MKRETSSPKLLSRGAEGTAANHRGAFCLSSPRLHPPLRPWESELQSPRWGLLRSSGFHNPPLTPGAHRSLTPTAPAKRHRGVLLYKWDRRTSVNSFGRGPPGHSLRLRAQVPARVEGAGGGRAGRLRRRSRSRRRRAGPGWAPGAYLGARPRARGAVAAPAGELLLTFWRLRRSRRSCAGASRRRCPAICRSPGGGGGTSARRGLGTVQLLRTRG